MAMDSTARMNIPCRPGADGDAIRDPQVALAELAFGSVSQDQMHRGIHLAMLTTDALELDLSDPAQRHFGNYELLELIGEGGMGVVYRARQINLDREVAIKLLAAGPWASHEFIDRFKREAQHAARMQHPNIVTIYEVGTAEELHYFSMRLVRGMSLAQALRENGGTFPDRRAAQLMHTIAEAVAYAHSLGVLHLDLKPANVLLDENQVPHVADFGLARQLDRVQALDNTELSGTPSYMAPEQAELGSLPLTAATDIWGLGAILYELVTGHPPFQGDTTQETLRLLLSAQVRRPRRARPDLAPDLESIILKCLARNPLHRYGSARDLSDDLARFIEHREVRARPLNAVQRIGRWAAREPRLAGTALLATTLLLIGLATTGQQWRRAESNAAISSERLWESRREAALRQQLDGNGFRALSGLIANIEEIESHHPTPARIERRTVGAILNRGVRLIDRMVIADATPMATALSPDSSVLVVALNDLSVRWFDTRNLDELGRVDLAGLPTSDGSMRVPRLLRFTSNRRLRVTLDWLDFWSSPNDGNTYLIDLDEARVIEPPAEFPDWQESFFSADGRYALLRSETGIQLWQVDPWKAVSTPMREGGALSNSAPWIVGPDARYLFKDADDGFAAGSRNLTDLNQTLLHELPTNSKISAHTENSSGSQIALGDTQGRVFVVDPSNNHVRQLSAPLGSRVTWMAYSEDDAWIAAVRMDGSTFAFDAKTGISVNAGLMNCEFQPLQVQLSHRARVLIASGERGIAIWRLPAPGPIGLEATRLLAQPETGLAGTNAVSLSAQSGMLATATLDGEVRLWRIPAAPLLPARSAMQVAGNLQFDGEHLVDVAGSQVRVISLLGAPATPWTDLQQPPGFAELVGDGRILVVTVGNKLHVYDPATMQRRYVTITLPGNPLRLVASKDGQRLALSFADTGPDGFVEHLQVLDLGSGMPDATGITVKGPLRQLEFSGDGRRLLATGPEGGAITVFDSVDMRVVGRIAQDTARPVLWARFDSNHPNEQVWLLARDADDARANEAELSVWNLATGEQAERHRIPGIFPIGLGAVGGSPIVAAREQILLDPAAPRSRGQIYLGRGEATAVIAVSHDQQIIAQAMGRDVQLYDAATLSPVGAPLPSNLGTYDFPAQLAFSPDDKQLLGRSLLSGQWLLWNVEADTRAPSDLHRDAALLEPVVPGRHILQVPDVAQSKRLRHNDPGAWREAETRPEMPVARWLGEIPIRARHPDLSPVMLDLTAAYTIAPLGVRDNANTVLAAPTQLPFGLARFGDTEFDVRGAIELRWAENHRKPRNLATVFDKAIGISVPPIPIAAFHVLLYAPQNGPEPEEREYAYLRLHYQNGSTALLPMRTQREVPGLSDRDHPVPLAWVRSDQLYLLGYRNQILVGNPRLPNPHPRQLIRSLDIETSTAYWSEPVVFAITVEPAISSADSRMERNEAGMK